MKIINIILTVLIVLLSITAGLAKVMQVPEEMMFLLKFGLNNTMILIFGTVQIIGGLLLVIPKLKILGLALTTITFLISALLIFLNGNLLFTIISMLPIATALFLTYQTIKTSNTTDELNN